LAEDLGLVEQLLRGDIRSYELEKRYLRPDGQTVHVLLSVSLLHRDGEPPRRGPGRSVPDRPAPR
ncbi:MAG: hypothetical protein WD232_04795, partial [Acidimicrobiales bacterium]